MHHPVTVRGAGDRSPFVGVGSLPNKGPWNPVQQSGALDGGRRRPTRSCAIDSLAAVARISVSRGVVSQSPRPTVLRIGDTCPGLASGNRTGVRAAVSD